MDNTNMEQNSAQGSGRNPYETGAQTNPYVEAEQAARQTAAAPPKKKKNKKLGIALVIIGAVLMIAGFAVLFMGNYGDVLETAEPVNVFEAAATDEYAFVNIQYMTEAVAYYEAMDNLQFYIALDADWNPAVICIHEEDLDTYRPYIDWLYDESYEGGPLEIQAYGYAQPFDDELRQFVMEGFAYDFGEGIIDETNFEDYFGEYYLQIGQKNGSYEISNLGIVLLLAAIVLIVIGGALVYEKPEPIPAPAMGSPIIEDKRGNVPLGILGAFLGALLGALLWAVIGALGYISGWIGFLIIIFAHTGYEIFSHRSGKLGAVISVLFSLPMVALGTYLSYVWTYYCAANENMSGFTPITRAAVELINYMKNDSDVLEEFVQNMLMGYVFMIVAAVLVLIGSLGGKKKKK